MGAIFICFFFATTKPIVMRTGRQPKQMKLNVFTRESQHRTVCQKMGSTDSFCKTTYPRACLNINPLPSPSLPLVLGVCAPPYRQEAGVQWGDELGRRCASVGTRQGCGGRQCPPQPTTTPHTTTPGPHNCYFCPNTTLGHPRMVFSALCLPLSNMHCDHCSTPVGLKSHRAPALRARHPHGLGKPLGHFVPVPPQPSTSWHALGRRGFRLGGEGR